MAMDSIYRDAAPDEIALPMEPIEDYADDEVYDDDMAYGDPVDAVNGFFDDGENTHGHGWRNALVILLCLAVVGGLAYVGFTKGRDWINARSAKPADYAGPGGDQVTITIPPGAGAATQAQILFTADIIASEQAFTDAVKADTVTFNKVQAGDHLMLKQMSAADALTRLADTRYVQRTQVTVKEGLNVADTFAAINTKTGISLDDLNAVVADPSDLGLPDWAVLKGSDPLEGFLFPETYAYDTNSTATSVLKMMVAQFNSTMADLDFVNKAKKEGLTPYQALVLASIIQKEGADETYAADIAQVFINRLNKKPPMKLQSDATVIYACSLTQACSAAGTTWTNAQQRANDSPYNTYKYAGLPPGPIANPGAVALKAAVNATTGNYLYFTAIDGNGTTAFASTAAGHQANVNKMQTWCNNNPGKCTG